MDEQEFKSKLTHVKHLMKVHEDDSETTQYLKGYYKGLNRLYYQDDWESEEVHENHMGYGLENNRHPDLGSGYRDGFYGKSIKGVGGGRPKFEEDIQKRRNITLSDSLADKAKSIGDGNISNGIRIALEKYEK